MCERYVIGCVFARYPLLRTALKLTTAWLGLALVLLCVLLWVVAIALPCAWVSSRGHVVGLCGDSIWVEWNGPKSSYVPMNGFYLSSGDNGDVWQFGRPGGRAWWVNLRTATGIRLWIPAVFIAVALMATVWRRVFPFQAHLCRKCGYDLRGLPGGTIICPECGHESGR